MKNHLHSKQLLILGILAPTEEIYSNLQFGATAVLLLLMCAMYIINYSVCYMALILGNN